MIRVSRVQQGRTRQCLGLLALPVRMGLQALPVPQVPPELMVRLVSRATRVTLALRDLREVWVLLGQLDKMERQERQDRKAPLE